MGWDQAGGIVTTDTGTACGNWGGGGEGAGAPRNARGGGGEHDKYERDIKKRSREGTVPHRLHYIGELRKEYNNMQGRKRMGKVKRDTVKFAYFIHSMCELRLETEVDQRWDERQVKILL